MPMVPDCFQLWSILLLERLHNQGQNLHLKRPLKTVTEDTHSTKWIQPNPRYSLFNHMGSERQSNTYRLC